MEPPALTPLATAVLGLDAPERALVLGCGRGEPVFFLAREFPAARVRGVDPSPTRVAAAGSRHGLDPEGRVAFKRGRPRSLPYPDSFFDLLVAFDLAPAPREAARVLREGGVLLSVLTSAAGRAPAALRLWRRRRLARHGFVGLGENLAGSGSFSVARLGGGDAGRPPI